MSETSLDSSLLWQPQPVAWQWFLQVVDECCQSNPVIQSLRSEMARETGTRLVDWVDHLALDATRISDTQLRHLGFEYVVDVGGWAHSRGLFPWVVRPSGTGAFPVSGLAIKVASVDAYLLAHQIDPGTIRRADRCDSPRFAIVSSNDDCSLTVVERHGRRGWECETFSVATQLAISNTKHSFTDRPRPLVDAQVGFEAATKLFRQAAAVLGTHVACDIFFECERNYWQSRNRAALVQRRRQEALGLGWGNHDHHTYRSSRRHFKALIELLELQGFVCRESFFAGAEAGWGAQVLEQPQCGLVVFADVDLSPEEVANDFAHDGLSERDEYGTVGLWCQLHGEAIMAAGMHHLECQFDFDLAREQLEAAGVPTMAPFTDFDFLRQAFTEAEMWSVPHDHLQHLVHAGVITSEHAERFDQQGARGSHLEILERNDGYKGFNQTGISQIISRTDPRN